MMRCGYCKMRLSRCHCRRQKPDAEIKRRTKIEAVQVEPPKGQTTIHLIGASPRVQLRWWGQWKPAPNLLKTDDKAPRRSATPKGGTEKVHACMQND
jgi:DTW domain-containing protein YfiP